MLDVPNLIIDYLQAEWTLESPTVADIAWTTDEFNPNNPKLQILFEDLGNKTTFITDGCYKVEHQVKVTVYVRPINYTPATIASFKTIFLNVKTEIDSILNNGKFLVTNIPSLELSGWEPIEMSVGRDIKSNKEPLTFTDEEIVTAIYFLGS